MRKLRVFYIFPQSRRDQLKLYREGRTSNLSFQGIFFMKQSGKIFPFFSDRSFSPWNVFHWLVWPLEQYSIAKVRCGFKLDQSIVLLPFMYKADVIVATADSVGLPILLLRKIGFLQTPVVHVTLGLADALEQKKGIFGKFCIGLLKSADAIVCYAESEKKLLVKKWGVDLKKTFFVPFGMDTKFYARDFRRKQEDFIIAVGRDSARDYSTLLQAVDGSQYKLKLVCDPKNIEGLSIPSNVQIYHSIPEEELRQMYMSARLAIVPLRNVLRPTGQIALLQSLSMGVPTIVSRVLGITTAYHFTHRRHCFFVPPEDVKALRRAIDFLFKQKKIARRLRQEGKTLVRRSYSQERFAREMLEIITKTAKSYDLAVYFDG